MKRKQKMDDIKVIQDKLSEEIFKGVLFTHGASGYDTTSGSFIIGQLKAFKLLRANEIRRKGSILFGKDDANLD